MNGIINILKPPGMTSHNVVSFLRRLSSMRRIGHTGTLDPGAAGVLPVCLGQATRVSEYVLHMDKVYRAELTLGKSTDTEDASGTMVAEQAVPVLNKQEITKVLSSFVGQQTQIPPMYSAVKVGGKKLYELARQGGEVDRKAREIHVYSMKLLQVDKQKITFDVACSRGTYVRTLCREIAEKLGTVGHMSFLLRTGVGPFLLQDSFTLEELSALGQKESLSAVLLSADTALGHLPAISLSHQQAGRVANGNTISLDTVDLSEGSLVRIYAEKQQFLAVGRIKEGRLKPEKVFNKD
ncbi:tRNA pseudouridine(55) synthase TruB [Dethiobacter alkaliphilus]|uniref:tRNA pseudouridine synthase B n=1 Tax=Dethiobacter alkaliphilus AHT 1 TaxID=555088 RepID=C0GIW2_DETAL|nr:tRNA pseudouridine(55) synthase TruB [Dethiobacter alkaliphilus]EEG76776.1 tRNA pseudouridine synthase B [Dethiobacter alkaliphilus AHT 1]